MLFICELSVGRRDLHGLTHSFPTRRSSDLGKPGDRGGFFDGNYTAETRRRGGRKRSYTRIPTSIKRIFILCVSASRSEEHTSELQSLMRISYAVFCLNKKTSPHKVNKPC